MARTKESVMLHDLAVLKVQRRESVALFKAALRTLKQERRGRTVLPGQDWTAVVAHGNDVARAARDSMIHHRVHIHRLNGEIRRREVRLFGEADPMLEEPVLPSFDYAMFTSPQSPPPAPRKAPTTSAQRQQRRRRTEVEILRAIWW